MRRSGERAEKPKHVSRIVLEDEEETLKKRKPPEPLDHWVLKLLEQDAPPVVAEGDERVMGTVVWVGPKVCRIRVPGAELDCELSPDISRHQQTAIAVGDEVVGYRAEEHIIVREVLPRRSRLSRPDPGNPNIERLVVANVDVIVITVSVKTPPLHPRLIDRYLVAIQRGGIAAAICVNKLDLITDPAERESELAKLKPYEAAGVEVTTCSTLTHEGMAKLRQVIEGKTCAFVGHSGVGKSSILNALHPELGLLTKSVSEGYGRGRHTTTASSLYTLSGGTRLIDTPGIRSFGLWKMEAGELVWYFPEFAGHNCKFSDCTHRHEPFCGVKAAVEAGTVSPARYETYLRMLGE
jgi:ribosome biogenesis GTPase